MEFGTLVIPHPQRAIGDTLYAEERGFAQAWFPDSHMIYGDVYACMALAAQQTHRIALGTGVSVSDNRIAPVTAAAIGTINRIAPGRVTLGFGTGHTARRVMGSPPVRLAQFREEVRTIRDLLRSGEAVYEDQAAPRKIRFLHREQHFINLDVPIAFYVAANAPRALAIAGEFGDGIITSAMAPKQIESVSKYAGEGARAAGRDVRQLPIVSLTHVCVLQAGEKFDSPRLVDMVGHVVVSGLHAIASGFGSGRLWSSPELRQSYDAYMEYVAEMDPAERHFRIHTGHCIYLPPDERRFVTAEAIRAAAIVGSRDEVIARIKALEQAGVRQLIVNPPFDRFRETIDEISRELIGRV